LVYRFRLRNFPWYLRTHPFDIFDVEQGDLQRLLEEVRFIILLEFCNANVIRVSGMRLRKMKHPQVALQTARFQGASWQRAWEGSTTTL
jgi:hypothetical protein